MKCYEVTGMVSAEKRLSALDELSLITLRSSEGEGLVAADLLGVRPGDRVVVSPSGAQAGYSSIDWGHIRKKTMSPSCWTTVSSASVQIFHRGSAASRRVCTKSCPLVCSSSRKR